MLCHEVTAYCSCSTPQLENLMYYTENNHKKVVLRDFYLSKFENGSITEPCGTPEYLGKEPPSSLSTHPLNVLRNSFS